MSKVFSLTPGAIYLIAIQASVRAGLPSTLKPHDLRRTYAKLSRDGGAPLEQIQATLGHASLTTTQRYLGTTLATKPGTACGDYIGIKD